MFKLKDCESLMPTAAHTRSATGFSQIFRALNNRNYRLFFFGQGASLVGTWMQTIAMGWLVYRISHSPFQLGLIGFAGQLPMLLLTPFAGVLSDRWQRRRVLVATQTLAMLQAFTLAYLTLSGHIQVWQIMILAVLLGLVNSFDMPTRQAFTLEMVGRKEDLANAIALNSSVFNASRLIGPTIAGILISLVGEGTCFLLNGISYLFVIAALLSMRLAPPVAKPRPAKILNDLRVGVQYAFGFLPIRNILLLLGLVSLVGSTSVPMSKGRGVHPGLERLVIGPTGHHQPGGALVGGLEQLEALETCLVVDRTGACGEPASQFVTAV